MNNIVNYFGQKVANDIGKLLNALEFSDESVVATAIFEYDYGKAFDDTALDDGTFALCAISSLVAQQSDFALEYHVKQALENGVSKREIKEIVFVNHSFIGWPRTFDFLEKMGKRIK
jgi:AhpD family alkylhydroperoxidase